jgi:pimeloyl-ACP methyl ester carboxylesterase
MQRYLSGGGAAMKASLNGAKIGYESFGSGPAIVVLHDGPSNREIGNLFSPLAEGGYRVIVTHLDGFGKRLNGSDLTAYSEKAVSLLNFLGIGRAVIFGIGQGGIVLLNILDTYPHRVAASSLVIGSTTAEQIRRLAERLEGSLETGDGHVDFKEGLLCALPAARKEKTARSPLPHLRSWINGVCSKNLYLSIIQHRSASRADIDIPPMIVEPEEGETVCQPRPAKRNSRTMRNRVALINAHIAALFQCLSSSEEEIDTGEIVPDPS